MLHLAHRTRLDGAGYEIGAGLLSVPAERDVTPCSEPHTTFSNRDRAALREDDRAGG